MMYYFVPIIVTLLEYKPVTFNFEEPITLWLNQIINVTVIVMAYNWSKKCNQNNFLRKICQRGFPSPPVHVSLARCMNR